MDKLYESLTPEQRVEDRKLRSLQVIVDNAGRQIVTGYLNKVEAEKISDTVRKAAMNIIPDQMELYDMIYGPRFRHWIDHFCTE